MKRLTIILISLSILSCSETPSESEPDFNDIDLNVEVNRDTFYPEYHKLSILEITNQSSDIAYLYSGDNIEIQKRINGAWVSLQREQSQYASFSYPLFPEQELNRAVDFTKFEEFSSESSINGEYRLKVIICDIETSEACPTEAADEEVISNTFILEDLDVPYSEIDPRIEQVNVDITLSKTVLSYTEDDAISLTITNNSEFPVYLSSYIAQFQRFLNNEWVDGINGAPTSGIWFVVDGGPERYKLDPGETYEGLGGRNTTLPLSNLSNTTGKFRFDIFNLCLDKPSSEGACPSPIRVEDKVSESFTVVE